MLQVENCFVCLHVLQSFAMSGVLASVSHHLSKGLAKGLQPAHLALRQLSLSYCRYMAFPVRDRYNPVNSSDLPLHHTRLRSGRIFRGSALLIRKTTSLPLGSRRLHPISFCISRAVLASPDFFGPCMSAAPKLVYFAGSAEPAAGGQAAKKPNTKGVSVSATASDPVQSSTRVIELTCALAHA
jgi:hypothetical protein